MAAIRRRDLLPETRQHTLTDWDLRQSLATVGQLIPVWYYESKLLDGARRLAQCELLGIAPTRVVISDRVEAARMLWRIHPRRAFDFFAPRRHSGVRRKELAFLFGCPVTEIPTPREVIDYQRKRRQTASDSIAVLPGVPLPRGVYAQAKARCRENGTNLSAMLRHYVHQLAGVAYPHPLERDVARVE